MIDYPKNKDSILITLHSQFAENQNHHQKIFIQFLIALLTLFGGYGYIYTHTNPNIPVTQTFIQNINCIEYYSGNTLIITSIIVIAILLLLNVILLNLGYSFRRDQFINKKIREKYLDPNEYENVFGKLYNPGNKPKYDYLPDFYNIFFWFILGFQIFIFTITCCKENVLCFENNCMGFLLIMSDIILVLLSPCIYCCYYSKYRKYIIEEEEKK